MIHVFAIDILLGFIGIAAGIIDSVAGSGGMLTVPALLALGIPPVYALGTNKLQESVGQIVATHRFYRSGELQFRIIMITAIFTAIGASIGATVVQMVHADLLRKIIPALIMLVLVYHILSGKFFSERVSARLTLIAFALLFGIGIGFYSGFFGPGTGSLCAALFLFFLSMNMKQATMHAKPINLICNLVALIWFVIQRHVLFSLVIPMSAGQIVGASLGAQWVIKKGDFFVKRFFMIIVILLTMILLYQSL